MVDSLKLSELTEASNVVGTDLFDTSKDQGGGNYLSQKITAANVASSLVGLTNVGSATIGLTVDAGEVAIVTGPKGYVAVPYDCAIEKWYLVADKSGSIVIDVWKRNGAIPTVAHTITGSQKPTLSSQQINSSTNVNSWITSVTTGDIIGFNVDSVEAISRVTLTIKVTK